ncbi:MAG: ABC transporter permease, partial [Chloroflexi bacterium]|nr:ABC transporter permease [Chloroflexota bacterium]
MNRRRGKTERSVQAVLTNKPQSTSRLIWRQFRRHRLAKLGMMILAFIAFLTVFAPFFSPYNPEKSNLKSTYMPPQRLHFFDQDGKFHVIPFTYKLMKRLDPGTYQLIYEEDRSKKYHLRFFVRGWEYKL